MEWSAIVQEADALRARGEPRPDAPLPIMISRGRRYDNPSVVGLTRPLAVAPGMDMFGEPVMPNMDPSGQSAQPAQPGQPRPQSYAPSPY
ncbi:hypothetical protein E4U60_002650, partial [Claviceps pazoutovae]